MKTFDSISEPTDNTHEPRDLAPNSSSSSAEKKAQHFDWEQQLIAMEYARAAAGSASADRKLIVFNCVGGCFLLHQQVQGGLTKNSQFRSRNVNSSPNAVPRPATTSERGVRQNNGANVPT